MKFSKILSNDVLSLEPIQYYLKTFCKYHKMVTHSHDYMEIMYAESGMFELSVTDANATSYVKIHEGQLVFIDSNVIHKISVPDKAKIWNFEVVLSLQKNYFNTVDVLRQLPCFKKYVQSVRDFNIVSDNGKFLPIMKCLHSALTDNKHDFESNIIIQSLILNTFIELSHCSYKNDDRPLSIHVAKILSMIDNNLTDNLTPKEFSKRLGISESYLHRLFRQYTGTTIVNYVNRKRVEQAMHLLKSTDSSIIDIAVEVGFNTRQNFVQIFRKFVNMAPTEYRNEQKKKEYDIPIMEDKIHTQTSYKV